MNKAVSVNKVPFLLQSHWPDPAEFEMHEQECKSGHNTITFTDSEISILLNLLKNEAKFLQWRRQCDKETSSFFWERSDKNHPEETDMWFNGLKYILTKIAHNKKQESKINSLIRKIRQR